MLHRVRTGVQWRDPPRRCGPRKTAHERHRLWPAGGTWARLPQQVRAAADVAGESDWGVSADPTTVRAHRHAAGTPPHQPFVTPALPRGLALAKNSTAPAIGR
ncbi:transposase [Streptomyces kebangsaanensis]|uniref:Transposase n=1 Tax=Streptomyces kebangsaanensis TaxID=864058 RepID=A0ABW6KVI5_9ACTN